MRVGLLYPVFDPPLGGVENYFLHVAAALKQAGHDAVVYCGAPANEQTGPATVGGLAAWRHRPFEPVGMQRLWRPNEHVKHVCSALASAPRPDMAVARHAVYAVAAHQAWPDVPVVFAPADAWALREQQHAHAGRRRDRVLFSWFEPMIRSIERDALTNSHAVQTLSRRFADLLAETHDIQDRERWFVNPPGVDLDRFNPEPLDRAGLRRWGVPPEAWVLLSVGRDAPEKNLDGWLADFATLPRSVAGRSVHAVIVGVEPDGDLAASARQRGVEDRFHCVGRQSEVDRFYRSADIMVCPSVDEPFGHIFPEAMASGLPVLAYAPRASGAFPILTATAEIITHGRTGLLADSRVPYALADTALLALGDGSLRRRLGQAAREDCQRRFSWSRHAEKVVRSSELGVRSREGTTATLA